MDRTDLKKLRIQSRLNQSEMAERIGMKLRQYQSLERGPAILNPGHIAAINFASLQLAVDLRKQDLATEDALFLIREFNRIKNA